MMFHEFVEALCRVTDRVVGDFAGFERSSASSSERQSSTEEKIRIRDEEVKKQAEEEEAKKHKKHKRKGHMMTHYDKSLDGSGMMDDMSDSSSSYNPYPSSSSSDDEIPLKKEPLPVVASLDQSKEERGSTAEAGPKTAMHSNISEKLGRLRKQPPIDELDLGTKLQEYIRKTALMAMGQDYAYNFIRKNNLQSLAFLYYSSWTSADQWVFRQLAQV